MSKNINLEEFIRNEQAKKLRFELCKVDLKKDVDPSKISVPTYPSSLITGIYYKNDLCAILGFEEINPLTLYINQIQGLKTKRSYKVLTSLEWERALIRDFIKSGIENNYSQFLSTSSLKESYGETSIQGIQRLIQRYDIPLNQEKFHLNPNTNIFERREE